MGKLEESTNEMSMKEGGSSKKVECGEFFI